MNWFAVALGQISEENIQFWHSESYLWPTQGRSQLAGEGRGPARGTEWPGEGWGVSSSA